MRSKKQCPEISSTPSTPTTTMLNNDGNVILCLVVNVSQDCPEDKGKELVEPAEKAEKKKDEGESSRPIRKGRYKCDKCLKKFSFYQALVAHRASQHKKKDKDQVEIDDAGGGERHVMKKGCRGSGGAQATQKKKRVFTCPSCSEVFRSGVALGGHKRVVHSSTPVVTEPITVVGEEQEKITSSRRIAIDLNLPPPIDDDDVDE